MAKQPYIAPTNVTLHPDTGKPVSLGNVYFGIADLDPEIEANRITVEVVQESGVVVQIPPAAQPLLMTAGVIVYQGSAVNVLVDGVYSLKITDSLGAQVYYVPRKNESAAAVSGGAGSIPTNGSFEFETAVTGKPDSWAIAESSGGTIVTDTDSAHGLKSLRFTGTDGTGAGTATSSRFDVLAGDNLGIRFSYKATAIDVQNKVDINWYDSANSIITTTNVINEGAANPLVYLDTNVTMVTPAAAKTAEIVITGIAGTGTATTGSSYFDAFDVYPLRSKANEFYILTPSIIVNGDTTVNAWVTETMPVEVPIEAVAVKLTVMIAASGGVSAIGTCHVVDTGNPDGAILLNRVIRTRNDDAGSSPEADAINTTTVKLSGANQIDWRLDLIGISGRTDIVLLGYYL